MRALVLLTLLAVVAGCPSRPMEEPLPSAVLTTKNPYYETVEKDVDLLFMVDNSNSMIPRQQTLAKNFPRFIEALRSPKLGPVAPGAVCTEADRSGCKIPNVRIGVISSDLGAGNFSFETCETPGGDRGRLRTGPGKLATPGCPTPKDPWIMYTDDNNVAVTNIQGGDSTDPVQQVKDAFSCVAQLGDGGCGFEHQLESVRRALAGCESAGDAACKTNPGFIRKDAYLAVVWLTDEDDCSARRTEMFDPSQQGLNDPLGPLQSFRCTEFGLVCSEKLRQPGVKHNCAPGLDWLYSVDTYADFFRSLKPDGRLMLFAIAAPTEPVEVGLDNGAPTLKASCNGLAGPGYPAIRLATVVRSFGKDGHFNEGLVGDQKVDVNICAEDYSPALQLIGQKIVAKIGPQCITSPPLTKSGTLACSAADSIGPGVTCKASCLERVDCVVEEQIGSALPVALAKCPAELFDPKVPQSGCGASCPCWRVVPSQCKPGADGSPYAIQIMRPGEPPKGAVSIAQCATALAPWGSADLAALPQCQ
jgi:hypothetical protein